MFNVKWLNRYIVKTDEERVDSYRFSSLTFITI